MGNATASVPYHVHPRWRVEKYPFARSGNLLSPILTDRRSPPKALSFLMTKFPLTEAVPLLQDYLIQSALRMPEKVALVCEERRVTYAELETRSNALSHGLVRCGVRRGDRVIIFMDNSVEAALAFWAVLKANAVVSVVSPLTKIDKLAYLLNDCQAVALVTHADFLSIACEAASRAPGLRNTIVAGSPSEEMLKNMPGVWSFEDLLSGLPSNQTPPRCCIDIDLAAIIYTSGSTGEPKGVMLSHRNMLTAATSIAAYLEISSDDVILCVLPLSFDYGLYQMIMAFRQGARLVLEQSFAFPAKVLQTVVEEKVTGFPGVPTIFAILAEMKNLNVYDFCSIRFVSNTAAALPLRQIEALKRIFPQAKIFSMYGLTECKRCSYLPPEDLDRKPDSVGIAIPNTELWVEDENGNHLGPGQVGQLVVRGATVMKGYWGKPEATAKKLRPGLFSGEMVLHTGDYCKMDEEGYLYFVGRMDDIIKSRGEKVSPREVENVLMNIQGVKEAAVIGVPDEVLGQSIKAFVVLESGMGLTVKELQRECLRRLENFMVPHEIELVPDLPKTSSGKIKKTGLS
jgi:amino acid adenylation domain-containing protein